MSDLLQQLRAHLPCSGCDDCTDLGYAAANEIERLRMLLTHVAPILREAGYTETADVLERALPAIEREGLV